MDSHHIRATHSGILTSVNSTAAFATVSPLTQLDLCSQKTPRGISPVNSNHSVHSNVAKIHSKLPAAMELFHIFQLAYRYFIRNSLLCFIFPDPFHIFSALDTSPDQDMTANFKRRCIAGISAPADAWYVI